MYNLLTRNLERNMAIKFFIHHCFENFRYIETKKFQIFKGFEWMGKEEVFFPEINK